jgi:splicing factor 3A subunit 1
MANGRRTGEKGRRGDKTIRKLNEVRLSLASSAYVFVLTLPQVAFAEIDWHDYAIVQTIEFTAADVNAELPPPMSLQEVENMTLAQKRMAAMIMENTADDIEAHKAKQAAAEAEAARAVGTAGAHDEDGDAVMEESDDEEDTKKQEEEKRQRELARAQAMQAMPTTAGPMKIVKDYVPNGMFCAVFRLTEPLL